MGKKSIQRRDNGAPARVESAYPGQVVLVLQGGGALGAYQVGVYQALHESGIEPNWVIGTSIGAINGAIIAGNPPAERLPKLSRFWDMMQAPAAPDLAMLWPAFAAALASAGVYARGVGGFFEPNPHAAWGVHAQLGVEQAAFYSTMPLQKTLAKLIDFDYVNAGHGRLTL